MAQGFNYGPGQNLTRNNRFAQMLMAQEANRAPIRSHTQGLASILRQGLAGYMQGQDANQLQAAQGAFATPLDQQPPGMDPGEQGPPQAPVDPYGSRRKRMMELLQGGNPHAGQMLPQIAQLSEAYRLGQEQRAQGMSDFERQLQLKQQYGGAGGDPTSNMRDFAEYQRLMTEFPPDKDGNLSPQVRVFKDFVSRSKLMNTGANFQLFDPASPTKPTVVADIDLKPGEEPAVKQEQARATAIGSAEGGELGDASARLSAAEASMPRLEEAVIQLKALGEVATYTTIGRGVDIARKEAGIDPTEGAVARSTYIAHVKNNVLPLLRQTFGAAFTAAEGDSLLATLGDPNMHPREKEAVLNAFISDKQAELKALRRQTNASDGLPPAPEGFE